MMDNRQLFDQHARAYTAEVDTAIRASGYSAEFFAGLKAELVGRVVEPGGAQQVLDFGCGIGITTRALAREFPGAEITGADISPESIAVAQELTARSGTRETFRIGEGDRLPFPDASFDLAFASCVFHHIERDTHTYWAREIKRVLRPGARFFLFEHNPYNPLTLRVVKTCPFDEGVVLLKSEYARQLLGSAGFSVGRPQYYFFFPRFLQRLRALEHGLSWLPIGAQYYVVGRIEEDEQTSGHG